MRSFLFLAVLCLVRAEPLSVLFAVKETSGAKRTLEKFPGEFELLEDVASAEGMLLVLGNTENEYMLSQMGLNITGRVQGRPFGEISAEMDPPDGYNTPQEIMEQMTELTNRFATLCTMIDLMEEYDVPLTHNGNSIKALKISDNVYVDEDEPNYLIVSAHHAREIITPQIAANIATKLLEDYLVDPRTRRIVDDHQIYVIWTMNPDGWNHVWDVDNNWRKNRRNNGANFGVDLNRNYPLMWNTPCGGSTVTSSNSYRGPSPASEAESQALIAMQEDRHFAKDLDWHSSGRDVRANYPACGGTLPPPLNQMFLDIGLQMANQMNYVQRASCCMAGNIDLAYHSQGALSFLSETGTTFQPPADQMREEVERVYPGFMFLISDDSTPISIQGHVHSADSGEPLAAEFEIPELSGFFSLNERLAYSNLPYGRYHLWIPNGVYQFVIRAEGRPPHQELVEVTQGTVHDFYV